MADNTILHCDINNFYASVEQVKDPSLRGKPIAVCGDPDKRHGIILAKSYPAKAYGIKTGDVIWEAQKKCRQLILLPADYDSYVEYSDKVFNIYTRYTDQVEPFGLDEGWLDVTGSIKLLGNGRKIADNIRKTVTEETGLTISVGVSFTKIFAKLGSDVNKPDATTVIDREHFKEKVWYLPVEELLMVGRQTLKKLNKFNINTIGDLANSDRELMYKTFGIVGIQLVNSANGIEDQEVRKYYEKIVPKSIGNSTTTPRDMNKRDEIKAVIYALSEQISYRLRKKGFLINGVSLYIKNNEFKGMRRQTKINNSTNNAQDIAEVALRLFDTKFSFDLPIRLVGVSTFDLVSYSDFKQKSFFQEEINTKNKLDKRIDELRERYGINIIKRGIIREHNELTDIYGNEDFQPFKRDL